MFYFLCATLFSFIFVYWLILKPSATKFKSPLDASSVGPPLDVGDLEISAGEIELLDTTATPPTIDTNLNSNGNGGEDNKHDKEKEKEKEKDKDKDDDEQTISSSDITPREEREEPDFIAQSIKVCFWLIIIIYLFIIAILSLLVLNNILGRSQSATTSNSDTFT